MEAEYVTIAVAGQASGVPERTIRRWIAAGYVPVVSGRGGRLVRLDDVMTYNEQYSARVREGRPVSAPAPPVTSGQRPPDTTGHADHERPVTSGQAAIGVVIEQAVRAAMVPLVERVEELARENGRLQAEVERLQAAQQAPQPREPSPAPTPAPTPKARPTPSWAARAIRWWRRS